MRSHASLTKTLFFISNQLLLGKKFIKHKSFYLILEVDNHPSFRRRSFRDTKHMISHQIYTFTLSLKKIMRFKKVDQKLLKRLKITFHFLYTLNLAMYYKSNMCFVVIWCLTKYMYTRIMVNPIL